MGDFKVGQTVYLKPNSLRNRSGDTITTTIEKIGRTYLTVKYGYRGLVFDKKTLSQKTDYSPDYYLYFDLQQIKDEEEFINLSIELRKTFSYRVNLTLDQLRRIMAIVKEATPCK